MELKPEDKGVLAVQEKSQPPARRAKKRSRGKATINSTVAVESHIETPDVMAAQARDRANRQIVSAATAYTEAMQSGVPKLLEHMTRVDAMVAEQLLGGSIEAYGGDDDLVDEIALIEEV